MADNVDVTEGAGKTVASDDIQVDGSHGQGQVQFVKLVDGTLNGTGSIRVNQAAKANAITVAPASDISDATYIGDIKFGEALPAGTNAIGKLAANSGVDIGDVTLTAGTAAIGKLAANSGVDIGDVDVTSIVPGVAATNLGKAEDAGHSTGDVGVMALTVRQDTAAALGGTDADYQPLITDASGRLHIAPLVAGSAAIGKLAANTGVDIGDVDVTSVIAGVGATNLGKARDSALGATDTGVMALAVRDDTLTTLTPADGDYVPLRVSSTGQLHVTGAGGGTEYTEDIATANPIVGSAVMMERDDVIAALTPVEGDWAAFRCSAEGALWTQDFNSDAALTLLGTIDTDTGVIAGDTTSIDGKITACNTGAVVISSGTVTTVSTVTNLSQLGGTAITMDEGVHDAGCQRVTIATDDDGVLSLGIIDDWDATHASAASADGPQVMGAGYSAGLPTDVGADGDAARICTDRFGRIVRGLMPQWFNAIYDSADASGEGETVKAATASRKIYILSLTISVDAEMWVKLQDEDSNAITPKHWFKAGGGKTITYPPEAPLVLNVVNKALEVITEGAGNIGVEITGYLAV